MKCTSKSLLLVSLICTAITMQGCGKLHYSKPFEANPDNSNFSVVYGQESGKVKTFAADLCVVTKDVKTGTVEMNETAAAVLMDLNNAKVGYAKDANEKMNPASLTKVLTALVALENASTDKILTATENVYITESGAQLIGLKAGDTMTLEQALHVLLIYSANDVAMLIAENIGGTVDNFAEMMNKEANRIGATNSHFVNPHGLTDENHYTSAYDLYLILNEACKYDKFLEIIQKPSYETIYFDHDGKEKEVSIESTNRFVKEQATAPDNIQVIGGKTGTTAAAGHCLMLYSKNQTGAPFITVILHSDGGDVLYKEMEDLLGQIGK